MKSAWTTAGMRPRRPTRFGWPAAFFHPLHRRGYDRRQQGARRWLRSPAATSTPHAPRTGLPSCSVRTRRRLIITPSTGLDKGTSGLLCVARHAHAQRLLTRQLHTDSFIREYLAVTEGIPAQPEGVIDAPIARLGAGAKRAVCPGRPARRDALPRRANRRKPRARPPAAGNRAHPSDPRASVPYRLSHLRRLSLWPRTAGAERSFRAAFRAPALHPARHGRNGEHRRTDARKRWKNSSVYKNPPAAS